MSHTNSVINFNIGASNAGAIQEFQVLGKELDKLEAKKQKLAKPAAGEPSGKALAGKRDIRDALGGAGLDDLLEGVMTAKTAAMLGAAFATGKVFKALGEGAENASLKIRGAVDGTVKWNEAMGDAARSVPILGDFIRGWDGVIGSISGARYELEQLNKENAIRGAGLDKNDRMRKEFNAAVKVARDAAFMQAVPDDAQELARAQVTFRDKMQRIDELKQTPGAKSGQMAKDVAMMEAQARAELAAAEKKLQDQRNKVIIDAATQTEKEITRRMEDEEKERVRIAKESAEEKARLNADAMRASADLQDEIAGLRQGQTDKLIGIGKQTRMGALASGGSIGTANQLASRERASFNPMIQLMQSAEKRDERKLKALEILADKALRGEVSLLPIFN